MTNLYTHPADKSGTITSGATAQNIMAANTKRRGWWFYNASDTVMYVNDTTTATTTRGIAVQPGGILDTADDAEPAISKKAISVLCATTGKAFEAREW